MASRDLACPPGPRRRAWPHPDPVSGEYRAGPAGAREMRRGRSCREALSPCGLREVAASTFATVKWFTPTQLHVTLLRCAAKNGHPATAGHVGDKPAHGVRSSRRCWLMKLLTVLKYTEFKEISLQNKECIHEASRPTSCSVLSESLYLMQLQNMNLPSTHSARNASGQTQQQKERED